MIRLPPPPRGGRLASESVAGMDRNHWPLCVGIRSVGSGRRSDHAPRPAQRAQQAATQFALGAARAGMERHAVAKASAPCCAAVACDSSHARIIRRAHARARSPEPAIDADKCPSLRQAAVIVAAVAATPDWGEASIQRLST